MFSVWSPVGAKIRFGQCGLAVSLTKKYRFLQFLWISLIEKGRQCHLALLCLFYVDYSVIKPSHF